MSIQLHGDDLATMLAYLEYVELLAYGDELYEYPTPRKEELS